MTINTARSILQSSPVATVSCPTEDPQLGPAGQLTHALKFLVGGLDAAPRGNHADPGAAFQPFDARGHYARPPFLLARDSPVIHPSNRHPWPQGPPSWVQTVHTKPPGMTWLAIPGENLPASTPTCFSSFACLGSGMLSCIVALDVGTAPCLGLGRNAARTPERVPLCALRGGQELGRAGIYSL